MGAFSFEKNLHLQKQNLTHCGMCVIENIFFHAPVTLQSTPLLHLKQQFALRSASPRTLAGMGMLGMVSSGHLFTPCTTQCTFGAISTKVNAPGPSWQPSKDVTRANKQTAGRCGNPKTGAMELENWVLIKVMDNRLSES